MSNLNDKDLLIEIIDNPEGQKFQNLLKKEVLEYIGKDTLPENLSFPLDDKTIKLLSKLKNYCIENKKNDLPNSKAEDLDALWTKLVEKSIKCLRLFDTREPFHAKPDKTIVAYDIEKLTQVHKTCTKFEGMLYGSSASYRDHRFHAFRTWLIGLYVIIVRDFQVTDLDGVKENWEKYGGITNCEKISMWTIIAFCHDLGYPWEKVKEMLKFIEKTLKEILIDPIITADFSFKGTQAWKIEDIVNFISTKMKISTNEGETYNARKQSKYRIKFIESLEGSNHGIMSAIILCIKLLYFKESDFGLNEDYEYNPEDARQFYIRREILRAIAAHTCPDIYNVKITTFSSLLYICDEIQNWARKDWYELYSAQEENSKNVTINEFSENEIHYTEEIELKEEGKIGEFVFNSFDKGYSKYKKKFRDGQDSTQRNFDIIIKVIGKKGGHGLEGPTVEITISIKGNNQNDTFEVLYIHCSDDEKMKLTKIENSVFFHEFIQK